MKNETQEQEQEIEQPQEKDTRAAELKAIMKQAKTELKEITDIGKFTPNYRKVRVLTGNWFKNKGKDRDKLVGMVAEVKEWVASTEKIIADTE